MSRRVNSDRMAQSIDPDRDSQLTLLLARRRPV